MVTIGGVNRKFHHDTILYQFLGWRYDINRYHKLCHDTISIRFDPGACDQYEMMSYVYITQLRFMFDHKKQLKYDLTVFQEILFLSVVPDI